MKMNNLILKHFTILLNNGFQLKHRNYYNIVYTYTFINSNDYKIIISVDLREKFVDIKIKKPTKVLLAIEYGEIIENHEFDGLEDMLTSVRTCLQ